MEDKRLRKSEGDVEINIMYTYRGICILIVLMKMVVTKKIPIEKMPDELVKLFGKF